MDIFWSISVVAHHFLLPIFQPGDEEAAATGEEEEDAGVIKASPDTDTAFLFADHESKGESKPAGCVPDFENWLISTHFK